MMLSKIQLTTKQAEYVQNAHRRWNVAEGAVRSGKSHLAINYTIPSRLRAKRGKKGLSFILGVSLGNIERNVLSPMRDIWGDTLVSGIKGQENTAMLFGEKVYCLGGVDTKAISRLRGSEIKFCYCDELADLNEGVFEILKSRLSLDYSECHAACNPASPTHWLKRFLDTPGLDLYRQQYTIWDNPFLSKAYVDSLVREYKGTVYYDRLILGLWTLADGLIYPRYKDALEPTWEPGRNDKGETVNPVRYAVSVDYGTQNAFAALLWAQELGVWHIVKEYRYSGRDTGHQKTDADYVADMGEFLGNLPKDTPFIVDPSATSFHVAMRRAGFRVMKARNDVEDGIREANVCLCDGLVKISQDTPELQKEFAGYVWDDKAGSDKPVKENDHLMDAFRYGVATMNMRRVVEPYTSPFKRSKLR